MMPPNLCQLGSNHLPEQQRAIGPEVTFLCVKTLIERALGAKDSGRGTSFGGRWASVTGRRIKVPKTSPTPMATCENATAELIPPLGPNPQLGTSETHTAVLFFAGERVYKIKKAVQFPFVDLRDRE